jgi:hypothetical protein
VVCLLRNTAIDVFLIVVNETPKINSRENGRAVEERKYISYPSFQMQGFGVMMIEYCHFSPKFANCQEVILCPSSIN